MAHRTSDTRIQLFSPRLRRHEGKEQKSHIFNQNRSIAQRCSFLCQAQSEYASAKGVSRIFSVWKFDYCQFFQVINQTFCSILSCTDANVYMQFQHDAAGLCVRLQEGYPQATEVDYDFAPRSREDLLPICKGMFRDYFYNTCYPCYSGIIMPLDPLLEATGTSCLDLLPKRRRPLQLQQNVGETFGDYMSWNADLTQSSLLITSPLKSVTTFLLSLGISVGLRNCKCYVADPTICVFRLVRNNRSHKDALGSLKHRISSISIDTNTNRSSIRKTV